MEIENGKQLVYSHWNEKIGIESNIIRINNKSKTVEKYPPSKETLPVESWDFENYSYHFLA